MAKKPIPMRVSNRENVRLQAQRAFATSSSVASAHNDLVDVLGQTERRLLFLECRQDVLLTTLAEEVGAIQTALREAADAARLPWHKRKDAVITERIDAALGAVKHLGEAIATVEDRGVERVRGCLAARSIENGLRSVQAAVDARRAEETKAAAELATPAPFAEQGR